MRLGLGRGLGRARRAAASGAVTAKWDPSTADAFMVVSGGGLLAASLGAPEDFPPLVVSTLAHSTGKRVVRYIPTFRGPAGNGETLLSGTVPAGFSPLAEPNSDLPGWIFLCDGTVFHNGDVVDYGIPVASGEDAFCFRNFDLGYGWFDNKNHVYDADIEAGTNPHFTFTPNASMVLGGEVYSGDAEPASILLDPTYTRGTFLSENTP